MTITRDHVNSELQNLSVRNNSDALRASTENLQRARAALTASAFSSAEEEVAGFTSLTSGDTPIVQLTDDPEGVRALQSLTNQSDLETLTGSTMNPALGAEVISLGTPQAVAAAVADLLSVPISQVTSAGVGIASPDYQDIVSNTIVSNISTAISTKFGDALTQYTSSLIDGISKGFNQPVKDIVESKTNNLFNAIGIYADKRDLPLDIFKLTANLVDIGEFKTAAQGLVPYSSFDVIDIETAFSELDLTVAGNLN